MKNDAVIVALGVATLLLAKAVTVLSFRIFGTITLERCRYRNVRAVALTQMLSAITLSWADGIDADCVDKVVIAVIAVFAEESCVVLPLSSL